MLVTGVGMNHLSISWESMCVYKYSTNNIINFPPKLSINNASSRMLMINYSISDEKSYDWEVIGETVFISMKTIFTSSFLCSIIMFIPFDMRIYLFFYVKNLTFTFHYPSSNWVENTDSTLTSTLLVEGGLNHISSQNTRSTDHTYSHSHQLFWKIQTCQNDQLHAGYFFPLSFPFHSLIHFIFQWTISNLCHFEQINIYTFMNAQLKSSLSSRLDTCYQING